MLYEISKYVKTLLIENLSTADVAHTIIVKKRCYFHLGMIT